MYKNVQKALLPHFVNKNNRFRKKLEIWSVLYLNPGKVNFQKQFFYAFPGNFREFNHTFGYFENPDPEKVETGVLYGESEKYIDLLFRLITIPDTLFYKKILNIAIGGHWEADAINFFQAGLRSKVFANPRLTVDILKHKSDKEIQRFFFFFFQSVHPVYKAIPDTLKTMKSYDSKTYGLMEKGLHEALKQSGH